MFETLSDRLSGVFGALTRQGALTDGDPGQFRTGGFGTLRKTRAS